ncbi:MAG: YlbF family regulator [Christensenella sp.]|nr:YlbF family regulator [Christensenella sp.]
MVIEKARELGIALSESQEFRRMLQARAAIEENETLANTINLLQEKQRMIADLLAEGEYSDSRIDLSTLSNEIDDIQTELMESGPFVEMLDAQHAFEALMQRVNRVIAACIGADFSDEPTGACGGDCGGCGGCKH